LESRQWEEGRFFEWFSNFESCVTYLEVTECTGQQSASKPGEKCGLSEKKPVLKSGKPLSVKLLTCWECHFGSVRSILKDDLNIHQIAT
jgi:hypothetical protein